MSTITKEPPNNFFSLPDQPVPADMGRGEGSKLHSTYFEFRVTLPVIGGVAVAEMSNAELLVAAEKAGTFDFLNGPEEDGYNDLLKKKSE